MSSLSPGRRLAIYDEIREAADDLTFDLFPSSVKLSEWDDAETGVEEVQDLVERLGRENGARRGLDWGDVDILGAIALLDAAELRMAPGIIDTIGPND